MTKKDAIFPLVFVGLSFLFVIVSVMVYLSKGKSAKWIAYKIKIGALLLTLNATISSCHTVVKCYAPPAPRDIEIQGVNNMGELTISKLNNEIKGMANPPFAQELSYSLADSSLNVLQKGKIFPTDGKFDSEFEEIKFTIPQSIGVGKYELFIYMVGIEKQQPLNYHLKYSLIVKDE